MKILFVCRQNIGRSQMAMELYNQLHPGAADSAGTIVDMPDQTLEDAEAIKTITVMSELGIDVKQNTRTQITPELLDDYDKIIVMAEPENTPEWLRGNPKTVIWTIPDTKDATVDETRVTRDHLQKLVSKISE